MDDSLLALVHSPLTGPSTWEPTAEALRGLGRRAVVPAFGAVFERDPPFHDAVAAVVGDRLTEDGGPVTLVAHSGAGALLPAIAAAVPRVGGAVFVDALLPHPGKNWFGTVPEAMRERLLGMGEDGMLPKWSDWFPPEAIAELLPDAVQRSRVVAELPRLSLSYFEEIAPEVEAWPPDRCAYLRLSEAYGDEAAEAERRGWTVRTLESDHLAVATRPYQVAEVLAAVTADRR
ncbi:alpha/beta fold hydrolase [Glycomyces xiaoerkulensis]|uniref:alpha/beta fold hydrolase n=1 Tax=Glycomyces xiaoerkulensis TaxID=2038139 RepID=UPI000C264E41|nr:alpha/beta fold hydrolase [Glycomyces xiaoerkulensis]